MTREWDKFQYLTSGSKVLHNGHMRNKHKTDFTVCRAQYL